MSVAAIDTKVLNSLFDNQKRLDDVFDSIFDDENYFISSVYSSPSRSDCSAVSASRSFAPQRESLLTLREQYPHAYLLPVVLEIAAIYWVVANFF